MTTIEIGKTYRIGGMDGGYKAAAFDELDGNEVVLFRRASLASGKYKAGEIYGIELLAVAERAWTLVPGFFEVGKTYRQDTSSHTFKVLHVAELDGGRRKVAFGVSTSPNGAECPAVKHYIDGYEEVREGE